MADEDIYGDQSALAATLTVKTAAGAKYTIRAALTETVLQLKEKVQVESGVAVAQQKLIYAGSILKDERTLDSYGVKDGYTVHLVKAPAPAARATAPSTDAPSVATPTATTAPSATPAAPTAQPTPAAPTTPQSPFGLGGSSFAQMHERMMGNPEMMRQAMDNPMVRSIMSNPEMMRSILMSNPEMRAMVEANPEIGHMLNDPATLRQVSEMMRNPNLMQEMVRNTDRAMSNIEAHPEGFNHLRRMYQNIQEPMLHQGAARTTQPSGNAFDGLFTNPESETPAEPATTALPNPWAPSAPSRPAQAQQQTQRPMGFGANPFMFPTTPAATATATATATPNSTSTATPSQTQTPNPNPFAAAFGGNPMFGQPDPETLMQMMDNPYAQQMMSQISQNPEMFQQMVNSNPYLRQMMESNPMHRELLNNPEMIRLMFNPEIMRATAQLRRNMPGGTTGQAGFGGLGGFGGAAGTPLGGAGIDPFAGLFGANPSATPQPTTPAVPPQQLYASQLQQLHDMGFFDDDANIRALQATRGNVSLAVERLLQGL